MSASDNAFQELARIFSTRNNRILEIEILPPALGPLLQDECSVGITKKYLVQAFVTARRIFFGKSSSIEYGTPRTPHENENESESKVDLLKSELDIVFRAGELHPRNYYAFNYIRQVVGVLSNATKAQEGPSALAESILDSTLSWCLAHPSDISGWMFMLYLLEAVPRADLQLNTVQRVVRYALDVGWEGESLWTFVDLSVKALDLEETVINTLQRVTGISYTTIVTVPDDSMKNTALPVQSWKSWLTMARKYWDGYNQVGYNEP
ncbi:hypothetical protein APSETT444_000699 [Aspergillus pseudonomiae]